MSDGAVVAMAVAAWLAALAAVAVPWWVGAVIAVGGLAARSSLAVVVGVAVAVSGRAAADLHGMRVPWTPPMVTGEVVTVVRDPTPVAGAARAEVLLRHRHVDAWATGGAAATLASSATGQRFVVDGRIELLAGTAAQRARSRHLGARLLATHVERLDEGAPLMRATNRVRDVLARGAAPLGATRKALFLGFVLGDDRAEPADVVDEYRASGLSHLTAVSGENVAFVLAVAAPLLRRLSLRTRWASTLALVAWFAVLTRLEPSVLRAVAMAALTATAVLLARPASAVRLLALAVAALLLGDPLLVHGVGFQLSVGATASIAVLGRRLAARLPGPRALAEALAITLAAQLGVAPVATATFGSVPLASLPANLLAAPVAGPVMAWGMTAGLAAGIVPVLARWLQWPTAIALWWISGVARWAAAVPLGSIGLAASTVVTMAIVAILSGRRPLVLLAAIALAVVVVQASAQDRTAVPVDALALGRGCLLWTDRTGASVLTLGAADPAGVLDALRRRHVHQLSVLVVSTPSAAAAARAAPMIRRLRPATVLAPPGSPLRTALPFTGAPEATTVTAGSLRVTVTLLGPPLRVTVTREARAAT